MNEVKKQFLKSQKSEVTKTEGSTGDVGDVENIKTESVSQASGTGSNDEILDITVGRKNKKKRNRKPKAT